MQYLLLLDEVPLLAAQASDHRFVSASGHQLTFVGEFATPVR
jgi:hypothetical protein